MIKIDLITVGKMRNNAILELWNDFEKRLNWKLNLIEITGQNSSDEHKKILGRINNHAYVIAMDEKGKTIRSTEFAQKLDDMAASGQNHIQFIIGGADGISDEIRNRANFLLSFGKQTWPHMLARIMLIEQIYRAQQIIAGHPYHRD